MVHKAVVVAAGYGSRFFPVTRCVPKEMLPLGTRPALDLVIQELVDAGITDILILTSRRKKVLEDWFDRSPELEQVFASKPERRDKLNPPEVRVQFARQREMRGTGHALMLAAGFAGDDPILVAYPDDLFAGDNVTRQMIDAYRASGQSVLAVKDFGDEDVSRYGVVDVEPREDRFWSVRAMVEKPPRGTEPSKLVSLGRYLLTPGFFAHLAEGLEAHKEGEYYHVYGLQKLAAEGALVACDISSSGHQDTGEPLGYWKTVVEHALQDAKDGAAFRAWLTSRIS